MKKYNCSLVYQDGSGIKATDVTFKKISLDYFKLSGEIKKGYKKLKSGLDKVNFVSSFLSRGGVNIIIGVGGKAPHEELVNHTGFWKVTGKGVLPKSYFKTIAQKDV